MFTLLIQVVIVLVVLGVVLWLVNNFIPLDDRIKQLINVLVVALVALAVCVWLLRFAGLV